MILFLHAYIDINVMVFKAQEVTSLSYIFIT